jgi:hypothetical protein
VKSEALSRKSTALGALRLTGEVRHARRHMHGMPVSKSKHPARTPAAPSPSLPFVSSPVPPAPAMPGTVVQPAAGGAFPP